MRKRTDWPRTPEGKERRREQYRRSNKKKYDANPEQRVLDAGRYRAEKKGIPFTITVADIPTPEFCPVLGIKLERGDTGFCDNSPSVDRVVPTLGYVPGNVRVISFRANAIKKDATLAELKGIFEYMLEHEKRATQTGLPSEMAA